MTKATKRAVSQNWNKTENQYLGTAKAFYLTTSTEQSAPSATLSAMLPIRRLREAVPPTAPITIKSTAFSWASLNIISSGTPCLT